MRNLLFALVTGIAASASAANTWWVDANNYGKAGLDGRSQTTAYGTIQDALDDAKFGDGDIVKVLPGEYDKGERYLKSGGMTNRVAITKVCTIVSTGGKDVTHIVGKHDNTANGTGPAAIRCIYCTNSGAVRIEGFTIRDGAASGGTEDTLANHGSGFLGTHRNNMIVDCVISNCVAYKGVAARNATVIRTLESGNLATRSDGSANNAVTLFMSVVKNSRGGFACSTCDAVNCDMIGNANVLTGNGKYYNMFFADNTGVIQNDLRVTLYNCYTNVRDQLVAPALGDYRPIVGTGLIGAGDGSRLNAFSTVPLAEQAVDFMGHAFTMGETCDIGAAQGAIPVAGAIQAGPGGLIVNGVTLEKGDHLYATSYPTQFVVRAVPVEGRWLCGFRRTSYEKDRIHPDLDDTAYMMPPPTGVSTVETVYATIALYVNPNKDAGGQDIGSDDNDGSESAPFHTLQRAMDVSANSKPTVIFAAPGYYTEGGRNIHDVQNNKSFVTNRVCAQSNGNQVRLIGAARAGRSSSARPIP